MNATEEENVGDVHLSRELFSRNELVFPSVAYTSQSALSLSPSPSGIETFVPTQQSQIAPIPLVLLRLLPASSAEQEALRMNTKRSVTGGAAFVLVLVGSLAWTVVEAVYVLMSGATQAVESG